MAAFRRVAGGTAPTLAGIDPPLSLSARTKFPKDHGRGRQKFTHKKRQNGRWIKIAFLLPLFFLIRTAPRSENRAQSPRFVGRLLGATLAARQLSNGGISQAYRVNPNTNRSC